ncbi:MAG: putative toxin-antitoxin system toxin component, PIN family [Pseudomonadota bacterium]|jgi:putative PIN family toxin of toxin-antitoxin system
MMARVFIVDTNVLVAGLITRDTTSPTALILDAMLTGDMAYLLSPALLEEYRKVLLRPRVRSAHGLTEAQVDTVLTEIVANAVWREPAVAPMQSAPDPGDDHLWALLACEPGSTLVTGDRLLMENPPGRGGVISPSACVALFAEERR